MPTNPRWPVCVITSLSHQMAAYCYQHKDPRWPVCVITSLLEYSHQMEGLLLPTQGSWVASMCHYQPIGVLTPDGGLTATNTRILGGQYVSLPAYWSTHTRWRAYCYQHKDPRWPVCVITSHPGWPVCVITSLLEYSHQMEGLLLPTQGSWVASMCHYQPIGVLTPDGGLTATNTRILGGQYVSLPAYWSTHTRWRAYCYQHKDPRWPVCVITSLLEYSHQMEGLLLPTQGSWQQPSKDQPVLCYSLGLPWNL